MKVAMRDRGVCRQMVGVCRVVSGNEGQTDWTQMVGVSRVVSGSQGQRSL